MLGVAAAPLLTVCADDAVAGAGSAAAQTPLENVKPKVVTSDEPLNTFEQITTYNNFYEFGTDKGDPGALCRLAQDARRGRSRSTACAPSRRPSTSRTSSSRPARGAHLPAALRRGVVDGDPVDRHSARRRAQAGRAARRKAKYVGVHDAVRPARDAGPA